jgi:hypothetical protein
VQVNLQGLFYGNGNINTPNAGTPHSLSVGWENGGSAGTVSPLIPSGSSVGTTFTFNALVGQYFSFLSVRNATPTLGDSFATWQGNDRYAWSVPGRNTAGWQNNQDRMVTLALDTSVITQLWSLDGSGTIDISSYDFAMIHFFDTGSDGDYQDSVWLSLGARPVPLPAAAVLGLLGLAAASLKRRAA